MNICKRRARRKIWITAAICLILTGVCTVSARPVPAQAVTQQPAQTPAAARPVGTIKSIAGHIITLTPDSGSDVTTQVQDANKFVRLAPGQKDLTNDTP